MLQKINRYTHGFVAVPVILACREKGLFELLAHESPLSLEQMVKHLGANSGHFKVALRMLESLHWLSRNEHLKYSLTSEAAIHNQIPEDVLQLYHLPIESYLQGKQGKLLGRWIDRSCQLWNLDNPLIADFLDGLLLIPLLLTLHKHNLLASEEKPLLSSLSGTVQEELGKLFVHLGWANLKAGRLTLTEVGRFMGERALNTAIVASYTPMLSRIHDVLFGDCLSVFQRDASGHESHIDRTLNVMGSGFQHQKYFADLEESILSVFNQLPLAEQPKYITDMGCGDGTLLKRVWETIRFKSARGKAIEQYPLRLIGVDYNEASLTATTRTLAGLPHLVLQGDIGNPEQMVLSLKAHGIHDPENILHIRSFLDHDRPFIPPQKRNEVEERTHLHYQAVCVDGQGELIPPHVMVQSLVEHLERWSQVVTKHGLIILEVHCLEPRVVYQFLDKTENLHFDAFQGFSKQYLVEADVFLMSAAEVGLFPKLELSKRYPKTFPLTRITLNYFEKKPYKIRHAYLSDLPVLVNLEVKCWSEHLQASANEIRRRLELNPQGNLVLIIEDQIIGAVYSQTITSTEVLENVKYEQVPSLHTPQGSVIQLLALNILPEFQARGLGNELRDFMLYYCTLKGGIESVVGVTRCRNYVNYSQMPMTEYLKLHNEQRQLLDPIVGFHVSGGAEIRGIIANYRPEDAENFGMGILIEYNLRDSALHPLRDRQPLYTNSAISSSVPTLPATSATKENETVAALVKECVLKVLGSQRQAAYAPEQKMLDMGLDSLDLLELQTLLEERLGVNLSGTFFLQKNTPTAIITYFQNQVVQEKQSELASPVDSANEINTLENIVNQQKIPQVTRVVTEQQGRKLLIDGYWVIDFASCNYLGLDLHPKVKEAIPPALEKWGVHPSWTRLVASPAIYEELEEELAKLLGVPDVLVFPSVTLLQMGVLPLLTGNNGVIFGDIAAHRCIYEACCLAQHKGAQFIQYRHNDLNDLAEKLVKYPLEQVKIIVIDGVYSMSADFPDLPAYVRLAKEYNALIYMDDAHGFGILGENPSSDMPYGYKGNGMVNYFDLRFAEDNIIYVAGLSKAYSSYAAFLTCGDRQIQTNFRNAWTAIYSGPSPVASLASALAGLQVNLQEGDQLRKQIYHLTRKLVTQARAIGFEVDNSGYVPIVSVLVGDAQHIVDVCQLLWEYGILITPAIFPIVPLNKTALRFSITAANTEEEIDQAIKALEAVWDLLQKRKALLCK
ncbi:aminotransferase class I/II-fold pyridoxal phosphate-dependent enzyme [Limnofasciculus baicalensis]|uniref:Aminotransferase class I/II-fold pyridoxal phosphate-dependent enzyme n=9 Tax=Cyanobacteriota TaxID=1117 RepID=A0AAE3GQE6_9CYAN|nr:aminotransferase class I/II-fold pyridoxal phosphate-dependent enzyme [Limnofasciculus baicalensis]MCP2728259.1 aminotransferase class I/II-fold pyridoxal phosphate-dependent enzyme [Limnofasciculus baicalensis BBK-W-15]